MGKFTLFSGHLTLKILYQNDEIQVQQAGMGLPVFFPKALLCTSD